MKIILARHGEAEEYSQSGRDRDRKLTSKGQEDIRKMGVFIKQSGMNVSQIFYSPYVRTRQTAEIFADVLGIPSSTQDCEDLAPSHECERILRILKDYTNSTTILAIGHNPGIAYFAAQLIQSDLLFPNIPFVPGTTIAINVPIENFQRGQIIWMLSPFSLDSNFFLQSH